MSDRRPIGPVDMVWLLMDRPTNLMVIDSLLWFDEPVDWERLAAVVQRRLVDHYPVFRQRPSSTSAWGTAQWEDDPDFSLAHHLVRATLPEPGDDATLQRYVEAQMHVPLDREHPLWQLHLIDGYLDGAVVMARFHHALADGIALAHVLFSLTDEDDTGDLVVHEPDRPVDAGPGLASRALGTASSAVRGGRDLLRVAPRVLDPAAALEALTVVRQTLHIADKLLLGSRPESPLSGTPGLLKRAVWSRPRSLVDLKVVGRLSGATINDVVVSAVSGAIATYVADHGGEPTDLTTMVPVNIRPAGEPLPRELGNRFALAMLPLPTGLNQPLQRLAEAKARMDRIKRSPEPVLTYAILNAIGRAYPDLAHLAVDFFAAKTIGVTTNVVGPLAGRYLAGSRITGVLGWVPGSGRQTVGVCIVSYDRVVRVGFKVDAGVVADPQHLVHAFDEEMDALVRIAAAV